jgi:hypothetical protein
MQTDWRQKAHQRIATLSYQSWRQANTLKNGARAKYHRPYSIPAEAEELIRCLNENDEHAAKAIFVWGFNR